MEVLITLDTKPRALALLYYFVSENEKWIKANDPGFDLMASPIVYSNCCYGNWDFINQVIKNGKGDCVELSTILCAQLRCAGIPATIRVLDLSPELSHVQVVSQGRVIDPSVAKGMPYNPNDTRMFRL
jgi:transglutaminase-like putative cysteine protease